MSYAKCPGCNHEFKWGADEDSAIVDKQGSNWRSCRENPHWKLSFHMIEVHKDLMMHCPRRGEVGVRHREGPADHWYIRDHHRVCSYCGSMHPDDFLKAAEEHAELGPTDKSYKVYVDLPHPEPDAKRIISMRNFPPEPEAVDRWTRVTRDHVQMLQDGGWGMTAKELNFSDEGFADQWFQLAPNGPSIHAKFYFQHLSPEQRAKFIELHNAKKLNIGEPGYFYSTPFFATKAS